MLAKQKKSGTARYSVTFPVFGVINSRLINSLIIQGRTFVRHNYFIFIYVFSAWKENTRPSVT